MVIRLACVCVRAPDKQLIERFKQFSLTMCKEDAARGKVRSGGEVCVW